MTGDENCTVTHNLARNSNSLLGITSIISNEQPDLFAQNASFGVKIGYRHLSPSLDLFAQGNVLPTERTSDCDQNFCLGSREAQRTRGDKTT
jgi:hypothetical protein